MAYYIKLLKWMGMDMQGTPRFICHSVMFDGFERITLGNRVVLTHDVTCLTHDYSYTTGLIACGKEPPTDICLRQGIEIGNNVFIGMHTIILPGTTIPDNVIVGAGSVVKGTLEAGSVYAGNPARRICSIEAYTAKKAGLPENVFHVDRK